jgi:hypothetical protein
MKAVEWRESRLEPIPKGVWVYGISYDEFKARTGPSPVLQDQLGNYWTVEIYHLDGVPTIQRGYKPPAMWRFM